MLLSFRRTQGSHAGGRLGKGTPPERPLGCQLGGAVPWYGLLALMIPGSSQNFLINYLMERWALETLYHVVLKSVNTINPGIKLNP